MLLSQEVVDYVHDFANRAHGQLQLSIHGHLVALPSSRTVAAALVCIAAARLLPSLYGAVSFTNTTALLALWLCIELLFYLYQRPRLLRSFHPAPPPPIPPAGLAALYKARVLELQLPLDSLFSGWFDAPLQALRKGNVLDYFSYIFHHSRFSDLPGEEQCELQGVLAALEQRMGHSFPEGCDETLQFMGHLWEPMRCLHLPLAVYVAAEAVGWFSDVVLWCMGMTRCKHQASGLYYYVWDPASGTADAAGEQGLGGRLQQAALRGLTNLQGAVHDSFGSLVDLAQADRLSLRGVRQVRPPPPQLSAAHPPIVFVHGVMGLVLCLTLVKKLLDRCNRHPIIVLDIRSVTMRLCQRAMPFDHVATAAVDIVKSLGHEEACFVGHSYGTFVMSRIYKLFPQVVHSLVLTEPVAMLPVMPALLRNFLYRVPKLRELRDWQSVVRLLRALLARELSVAETFGREFFWHQLILWPQDLPPRSLVVLSGADDLVPSNVIARYLQSAAKTAPKTVEGSGQYAGDQPGVLYRPGAAHGDILTGLQYQDDVALAVAALLQGPWRGRTAPQAGPAAASRAMLRPRRLAQRCDSDACLA